MPSRERSNVMVEGETDRDAGTEGLKIFYPILASCSLDRNEVEEGDEQPARFYDCAIQLIQDDESISIASCEFSAGQKIKETKILEFKATYFVAITAGMLGELRKDLLDQMIKSAVWPRYRDLFIHVGSQTAAELPLLPTVPELRWLPEERREAAQETK